MQRATDESVSVVIPTYNRCLLLERALQSVIAQRYPIDEIIVVDDASTDDTLTMLQTQFPEITAIALPQNRGVSAARNAGIRHARSPWIAFLDSDDTWHPKKLSAQFSAIVSAMQRHEPHWICHTNEMWIRRGKRVNPMDKHYKVGGFIYEHCLSMCRISPSSVIIHRSVFDRVGTFDETLPACEDYDLWLRITSEYPVLYLDEPLITKYGGHDDQLSHRYWGMDRFRISALEKMVKAPHLSNEKRAATRQELIAKIEIVLAGARKRGKTDELDDYERKRSLYLT